MDLTYFRTANALPAHLKSLEMYCRKFVSDYSNVDEFIRKLDDEKEIRSTEYAKEFRSEFINQWIPNHNVSDKAKKKVENLPISIWDTFHPMVAKYWNSYSEMSRFFKTTEKIKIDFANSNANVNDILDVRKLNTIFFETELDDRAPKYIKSCLTYIVNNWNKSNWYYPGTALIQSSGSGKSRSVVALENLDVNVVYCSFMDGKGFPGKSEIADEIVNGEDVKFARYYYACLKVIAEHENVINVIIDHFF